MSECLVAVGRGDVLSWGEAVSHNVVSVPRTTGCILKVVNFTSLEKLIFFPKNKMWKKNHISPENC